MKFSNLLVAFGLVSSTYALPSFNMLTAKQQQDMLEVIKRGSLEPRQAATFGLKKIPDADHPFKAPSATAQRGPCPGLNVLANHGYLNREGITNFNELIYAQEEGMGWAPDLSTFLAALAVAVDGNPLNGKVSIGGPDKRVGTIPGLGKSTIPGGMLNHNAYEIDASLTRNDLYFGDNKNLNGTLYQQIWDVADEMNNGVINSQVMAVVRSNRYQASSRDNPEFTFAPIGALFFGADHFLWSTQVTSDEKTGELVPSTRETLSEMYGAKRTGENTWEYVDERYPDEWYRRSRPLTIPEVLADAVPTIALAVARAELPVGVTAQSFKSPNAFMCAMRQVVVGQVPAALKVLGAFNDLLSNIPATC